MMLHVAFFELPHLRKGCSAHLLFSLWGKYPTHGSMISVSTWLPASICHRTLLCNVDLSLDEDTHCTHSDRSLEERKISELVDQHNAHYLPVQIKFLEYPHRRKVANLKLRWSHSLNLMSFMITPLAWCSKAMQRHSSRRAVLCLGRALLNMHSLYEYSGMA